MRKGKLIGLLAMTAAFLLAGCSGSVETGPVPTITPRPTVTPAPTPTPVVIVENPVEEKQETVYDTKKYTEYYETENKLPQLKVAYQDTFEVGLDVLQIDVTEEKRKEIVLSQYNTIGCKEDLSPKILMDYEATRAAGNSKRIVLDFSGADVILKFAQENNIPVRGPRLITADTPDWAYTKDYDEDQVTVTVDEKGTKTTTIEYASADVMQARMENYIKDVMEYCNANYPGLIISWQVLDDPITASEQNDKKYSANHWMKSIGEDYVLRAMEQARACATAEQKLLVSQDALDEVNTLKAAASLFQSLADENLIDGIAIQAKYGNNGPNVLDMGTMMETLAKTGLELHFTEFYVDSNDGNQGDLDKTAEEMLARSTKRYKSYMTNFTNYKAKMSYNVVSVTFEGLSNETSNVNQPKDYYDIKTFQTVHGVRCYSYAYLFDEELKPMTTFFAAMGDVSIKAY